MLLMAQRGETRRRLVETTAGLLQRQGFHGTGLLQVLEESHAPRGSLYFHFPGGKEQLTVEAIEYSRDVVSAWLRKSLDAYPDPAAAFTDITERYARRLERSEFTLGCPIAAVALEGTPISDRLRGASEAALAAWENLLTGYLEAAGVDAARARPLATAFICSLEGALMLARARRSAEPMLAIGAQFKALLPAS
jgi:TetR/AcrR family transcriptional regulator, lmrAB and yxaGH operons repressor